MSYDLKSFVAENARRGIVPVIYRPHPLRNAIRVALGLWPMNAIQTFVRVPR